ncbi:Polycystic kidney disease protein 1-like 2, partial [Bulinus truncatus]
FESWDQKNLLNSVTEKLNNLMILNQEDLRVVKDVASIINFDSTASEEQKRELRTKMLSSLKDFHVQHVETIELVSFSVLLLSDTKKEIEENGLNYGVDIIDQMTRNLSEISIINIETAEHIARIQLLAASSLLSKSSYLGRKLNEDSELSSQEKFKKLKECLDRGRKLTDAVSFIALVLMKSLFLKQEPVTISTDDLDVQLEASHINLTSMFNLNSLDGQVKFSMPGKSLGEGIIKINTDFEVYRKNPYFGISENIEGEIPLVQLQFFEQKLNSLNFDKKGFRFSEPADVVLQFNAKEATVLSLSSPGIPNLLVKARYTNTISDFEYLYDEEMLMFPLQKLEILNKSSFSLVRKSNLVFLPMLQRFQIQKSIKYYRVLIRLKLYQKVDQNFFEGAKNMSLHNVTVHVVPYKMSCLHFDRDAHKFLSDKCLLSLFSNVRLIHCQCVVAAAFTGSYLVTPRLINPLDIGLFIEIFHNPLVVSMVIALWLTAIAAFLYGRRKDKEDEIKRNVTVLDDNKEDHSYIYLICVITGWFARAYTTSNVFIVIKGSWSKSETRLLNDTTKKLFQSGSENWFLLTTKEDLGNIQSIELWTDFSGCHPSWYLNCVYVQNMLTNESWMCTYNNWFNCEVGKANLKAEIPAIKEKDYMGKKLLQFVRLSQYNIRNEHLWFGMVAKSSYNMFTRVRRIVTGLTMLQTLMLVNLMFFGIVDFDDSRQFMEILGYKMHLTSIIIGFQSSLIIIIVGLSVAYMFNGVDPKPKPALELSEEEKELVQTRLERNHYNLTHPVFFNVKRHSDLTTISDSLIYNEERDKDKTFLNILLERKGANASENASHQRQSLKEELKAKSDDNFYYTRDLHYELRL